MEARSNRVVGCHADARTLVLTMAVLSGVLTYLDDMQKCNFIPH